MKAPPWFDWALALALLVGVELELATSDALRPTALLFAASAVGCVAVAFRRTAPLTATAVGLAALMVVSALEGFDSASTLGWFVAVLLLTASCGYYAERVWVGLGLVLGISGVAVVLEHGFEAEEVLFAWIMAGGAWFAGHALAVQTRAATLARDHARLVEERTQMLAEAAVADERLRIAREMHDVVAHSLSVMMLHVGGVRRLLRPDQAAEREALEDAERAGREATLEMHRVLEVLRAAPGGDPRPAPSLVRLDDLLDLARGAGLEARLRVEGIRTDLSPGLDLAAYRIIQEAVTNVVRHAHARRVDVRLRHRPDGIDLEVRDDGRGPGGPSGPGGHGLVGMRERAAAYGGSVTCGEHPDGGFVVRASLLASGGGAPLPVSGPP